MIVQNNFIYKLTDRIGTLDVFPLGENSFSIEYSKDDKDSNNSYKKQLSGKMTFVGDAFHRLMEMESSVYRCDEQVIEISKKCNTGNKVVFLGRISLNEAEFNLDKCFIVVKFMKDDSEKCFNDNKSNKIFPYRYFRNIFIYYCLILYKILIICFLIHSHISVL